MGIGMLFAHKRIVMKFKYAATGFFASMLILFIETIFVRYFELCYTGSISLYIGLVPATFFLFYIILHIELNERKAYKWLRVNGFLIYLIHPWIEFIIMVAESKFLKPYCGIQISSFLRFMLVFSMAFVLAIIIMCLSKKTRWKWLKKIY